MEEAPENGKESLHSLHANGMNKLPPFIKNASDKTFKTLLKKFLYSNLIYALDEYFNYSSM